MSFQQFGRAVKKAALRKSDRKWFPQWVGWYRGAVASNLIKHFLLSEYG